MAPAPSDLIRSFRLFEFDFSRDKFFSPKVPVLRNEALEQDYLVKAPKEHWAYLQQLDGLPFRKNSPKPPQPPLPARPPHLHVVRELREAEDLLEFLMRGSLGSLVRSLGTSGDEGPPQKVEPDSLRWTDDEHGQRMMNPLVLTAKGDAHSFYFTFASEPNLKSQDPKSLSYDLFGSHEGHEVERVSSTLHYRRKGFSLRQRMDTSTYGPDFPDNSEVTCEVQRGTLHEWSRYLENVEGPNALFWGRLKERLEREEDWGDILLDLGLQVFRSLDPSYLDDSLFITEMKEGRIQSIRPLKFSEGRLQSPIPVIGHIISTPWTDAYPGDEPPDVQIRSSPESVTFHQYLEHTLGPPLSPIYRDILTALFELHHPG